MNNKENIDLSWMDECDLRIIDAVIKSEVWERECNTDREVTIKNIINDWAKSRIKNNSENSRIVIELEKAFKINAEKS